MKNISTSLAAIAMLLLASCNSGGDKPADKTDSTGTTPKPETAAPAAFVPFKVMSTTHTVKDFATWKKVFDEGDSMRQANGLTYLSVCRDDANPNKVYVFLKMADLQKGKDFAANPSLKEAMQKAGVNSAPTFNYVDIVRFEESPAANKGRVRIAHKVKDFAAWLKGYDAEGKETRAANGLIDRAISRNISDTNMVYITFAISDLAKAKARINDPALKKIMMDAGVEGVPVIDYYTSVD